ncbi:MAG: hypothetical protein ACPG49_12475 [Chitinophagales bacterium]
MSFLKRLFKIISLLAFILLCLVFADLKLTRGYFFMYLVATPQMGKFADDFEGSFEYTIKKKANGNFDFRLQNKSIFPVNLILYRNDKFFYALDDSTLFDYAERAKLNFPIKVRGQGHGFDCGTGIGLATLNPFEEFDLELSYKELLENFSLYQDLTFEIIRNDSTLWVDCIHLQPILAISKQKKYSLLKDTKITQKDSVYVEHYLPVYSIFTGKQFNVYSNSIKLSYLDMLKSEIDYYNGIDTFFDKN